jgi:hypothetical protein
LVVTILSIAAYNYIKITKMRKDARKEVEGNQNLGEDADENGEAAAPMLSPRNRERGSTSSDASGRAKAAEATSLKRPHENE